MLGAIFGDIVGSVYEYNNHKSKDFQLFGRGCCFTDDTIMTVAVADALMQHDGRITNVDAYRGTLIRTMHRYGKRYPDADYGARFRGWLEYESTEPYGSFGNGAAMRVSPVAWCARSLEEALLLARVTAAVTHDHPEGIKGAEVAAGAAYLARVGGSMEDIEAFVGSRYLMDFTLDEIRPIYEFNETSQDTVPQAMQAFLEAVSFEDAIRNGVSIGGDTDTLCAITGGVAEAYFGMTDGEARQALSYLDPFLREKAERFQAAFLTNSFRQ